MDRVPDLSAVRTAVSETGRALLSALAAAASKSRASAVMTKALMSSELRARVGLSQAASEAVAAGALATGAGTLVYLTVRALMAASSRGRRRSGSESDDGGVRPAAYASIAVRYWAAGAFAGDVPQSRIRRYLTVSEGDLSSTGRIKSLSPEESGGVNGGLGGVQHAGSAPRDRHARVSDEAAAAEIVMAGLGAVPAAWERDGGRGGGGRGAAAAGGLAAAPPQPYRKPLPLHALLGQPDVQVEASIEAHAAHAARKEAAAVAVGGSSGRCPNLYAVCTCGALSIRLPFPAVSASSSGPVVSCPAVLCPPIAGGRPLVMAPYDAVGLTSGQHFSKMTSAQVLPAAGMPTLAQYPHSTRLSTQVAAHALQCSTCGAAPAFLFDTRLRPLPSRGGRALPTDAEAGEQRFTSLGFDVASLREGLKAAPEASEGDEADAAAATASVASGSSLHVYLYPFNGWYVARPDLRLPEEGLNGLPYPVPSSAVPASWGGKRRGSTGGASGSAAGRSPESSPRDDAASVASSVASGGEGVGFAVSDEGGRPESRSGSHRASSAPAARGSGLDGARPSRRDAGSSASVAGSVASRRSASSFTSERSGASKRGEEAASSHSKPHARTLRPGQPGYDPAVERFTDIYGNLAGADAGRGSKRSSSRRGREEGKGRRDSRYSTGDDSGSEEGSSSGSRSEADRYPQHSSQQQPQPWHRPARRGSIQEAMLAWAGQKPYVRVPEAERGERRRRSGDSSVGSSRAGSVRSAATADGWSTYTTPPHHHHYPGGGDGHERDSHRRAGGGGGKQVQWAVSSDGSIDALTAAAMAGGGGGGGGGGSRSSRRQKVRPAVAAAPPHPATFAPAPSFAPTPLQQQQQQQQPGGVVLRDVFGAPTRFGGPPPVASPQSLASSGLASSLLSGGTDAVSLSASSGRGAYVAAAAVVPASWGRDAASWRERYRYAGAYGSGDESGGGEGSVTGGAEAASGGAAAALPAASRSSNSSNGTSSGPHYTVGIAPIALGGGGGFTAVSAESHRLPPRRKASLPSSGEPAPAPVPVSAFQPATASTSGIATTGVRQTSAAPVLPHHAVADEAGPSYARLPPPLAAPQPAAALPARRAPTPSAEASAPTNAVSGPRQLPPVAPPRRGSLPPAAPAPAPAPLGLLSPGPPPAAPQPLPPSTPVRDAPSSSLSFLPPGEGDEFLSPDVGPATAARHRGDDWRPFMDTPSPAAPRVIYGGARKGRSGSLASLPDSLDDAGRGVLSAGAGASAAAGGAGGGRASRSASLASAVDSLDGGMEGHTGVASLDTSFEGGEGEPSAPAAPASAVAGGPRMVPALATAGKKKKRRGGR